LAVDVLAIWPYFAHWAVWLSRKTTGLCCNLYHAWFFQLSKPGAYRAGY